MRLFRKLPARERDKLKAWAHGYGNSADARYAQEFLTRQANRIQATLAVAVIAVLGGVAILMAASGMFSVALLLVPVITFYRVRELDRICTNPKSWVLDYLKENL